MNSPWHHLLTFKEIPCPVRLHLLVVEQESSSHWHWLLAPGELVNVEMAVTDQCLCSMCSQPCQASCFPHVSAICSLQLISWWSTRTAVVWSTALCDTAALVSPAAGVGQSCFSSLHCCQPCPQGSSPGPPRLPESAKPRELGQSHLSPICWRLDKLSHSLRFYSRDTSSCTTSLLHADKAKVTFNCA